MIKLTIKLFLPFLFILGISILTWHIHNTRDFKNVYEAGEKIYIAKLENKIDELTSTDGYIIPESGNLVFPFYPNSQIRITSQFGLRDDPFEDTGPITEEREHKGLDIAVKFVDIVSDKQTLVRSTVSGIVVEHWPAPNGYWHGDPLYGGKIIIEDKNGFRHLYAHLSETNSKIIFQGAYIKAGEEIGRMGDTGITTGPHLHYEIYKEENGITTWYDPLEYFDIRISENGRVMFPENKITHYTLEEK